MAILKVNKGLTKKRSVLTKGLGQDPSQTSIIDTHNINAGLDASQQDQENSDDPSQLRAVQNRWKVNGFVSLLWDKVIRTLARGTSKGIRSCKNGIQ